MLRWSDQTCMTTALLRSTAEALVPDVRLC